MKRLLALLLMLLFMGDVLMAAPALTRIKGQAVDAISGARIDYADVIVADEQGLSVTSGILENGSFLLESVPVQKVQVLIRLLGYEPYVSEMLSLEVGVDMDLGTIKMEPLSLGLGEVTVVGEKNQIVYKLDRQVISGTSSVTAGGGTAIDVLANTPSVLVDSNGGLTFRGSSNFLVYVDGKLSPLDGSAALQMVPAATIEDIEIITTPSARYKTEGDAGIINITTRRSNVSGWSGLVTATGSTLGTYSLDGTLTYQQGRNSVYFGGTSQDIHSKSEFWQQKTTLADGISSTSLSDGSRWSSNHTNTLKAGWQFVDGKTHNLMLDLLFGRTSAWRGGDMVYDETRDQVGSSASAASHHVYDAHDRYDLRKDLVQASLNYTWKLNERGDEFLATSRLRYDWFAREYTESNLFDMSGSRFEGTRGYEQEHHWDADGSLAYRLSYSSTGMLEVGYQYTTYSEHGRYTFKYWDREQGDFIWDPRQPFYYRRQIHSLYAMWNEQFGALSLEMGLRGDRVLDFMELPVMETKRDNKYDKLFPSAHLSYDAGSVGTFSAGYSFRANRPGIWNLEPYITYEDYYTKKKGNPDITPEYIHSVEAGWHKSFSGGSSLSATAYYRYRSDVTDWIRTPYEPGVTLDSIVNAGNMIEKGIEVSAVIKPTQWWTSNLNGSFYNYKFIATSPVCTDNHGNYYMVNWSNAFNVAKNTRIQLDTHVVGPRIMTQGREKSYYYWNLAARQTLMKGKLTLTLTAHDVFHTAKFVSIRKTATLDSHTIVRPRYANVLLSLSYNFNASKAKASTVSTNIFEGKDF